MNKADLIHVPSLLRASVGRPFAESTSAFHNWLNPVILEVESGRVKLEYPLREEMWNPMRTLHGGITAAILDDSVGLACFTLGKPNYHSTLNNSIDYLAAVPYGEQLIVHADILKNGKTIVHGQAEFYLKSSGKLVARGVSNLLYLGD